MKGQEIICIQCPLGCHGRVVTGGADDVVVLEGYKCKEGKKYAQAEAVRPLRILTATVIAEGKTRWLLPVKTDRAIPRNKLRECMKALAGVRVKPPIRTGQVIVPNISDTEANLVATAAFRT